MAIKEYPEVSYGFNQPLVVNNKNVLVYDRAPTANDIAEPGRPWLNRLTGDYYILTLISGSPQQSTWSKVADATPDGTNGQLYIARTGLTPVWANLNTDGSIGILEDAGSITLSVVGAQAAQYQTDNGNAAPLAGVTQMIGGTNIGSTGALNAVTFNLDDNVTLVGNLGAGGAVTAGVDFTMTSGTCTITSNQNAADCIYLRANGGTDETIRIRSDQGTGNGSVTVTSDVGSVNINSGKAANNALIINASNGAGGIDCDFGTGGASFVGTNGPFTIETGTGAINIGADAAQKNIVIGNVTGTTSVTCNVGTGNAEFGTSATAHNTLLGSTNTSSGTTLQSGTGNTSITSTGKIDADAASDVSLNSTGGTLNIGNDNNDFAINIGTQGERTTTIGNIVGASALAFNAGSGNIVMTATDSNISLISGTGAISIGADATAKNIVIGAVNDDSSVTVNSGTGDIALNSTLGSTIITATEDAADAIYLRTNGGTAETLRLHVDQGTGAASLALLSDVGGVSLTSGLAAANSIRLNASAAAGGFDFDYGTGGFTIDGGNGAFTVQTGTGAISIGADAAAKNVILSNKTGATDTTINAGTGGLTLDASGIVDVVPATDSQAAAAVTVNANVGVGTFTGLTTASAASQVLTVTNSVVTVGSAILCTLASVGAEDAQCTIQKVRPLAGSFTVAYKNNGAEALASDLILTFWVLAA